MKRYILSRGRPSIGFLTAALIGLSFNLICFAQRPGRSSTEVYRLSDNTVVDGASSTLLRGTDKLTMTIQTNGLPAGAYTAWWVIENHPEFCLERPCSLQDEENPLVQSSVLNAAGHVVSANGVGAFGASVTVGGPYHGEVLFGPGLVNPAGADVYVVVRYHGPVIPGMLKQQLSTYEGGCSINACSDQHIAFHLIQ